MTEYEGMSHYTDEPRFTIEQIDLLQRLRHSGMTRQEVLHALDTLERLEREHVQKFGRRHSPWGGGGARPVADSAPSEGNPGAAAGGGAPSLSPRATVATQTAFHGSALSPSPVSYDTSPPPTVAVPVPVVTAPPAQNGRDALVPVSNGKLSPPQYPLGHAPARPFGFEPPEEEMDIDDKVEELMRKDSNIIKEEIKAFLGSRRISQAVVAQVTGISQSRISHWLLQQGSDLSEQKKRAFYRWYQLEKTMPGATLAMKPAPVALEDMVEWPQSAAPVGCGPGSFRLRRGSRFTWRKECLAVMESYFNDNQYPDEAKREEIANACNAVIQKPGKKLSDLERVTSLKVYNWFANRRKEIKRRANIEAAILESHGIDVQSPGGQSNGDEADGTEYSEPVAEQGLGARALARGFGFGRGDLSSPVQDDSTGPSEHQDPITLAVEMAAVNHSILALAQQRRGSNDIKAEVLDDD
ncbi:homeobox-containing protein 1a isoform X1 [Electrophorus electricus]|uniref:homeobox-containing protein 1a isoform X1 n=2 Tax=Electrophorus electricus TaxID=8005 RepID=UPI0015D07A8E|nr:homeobox-containing protein 1a isoform X1 [Electrophorus electricus]XP_035388795.1 homeobox-containing protein 1a isoform X1 [Electrophorus electricus]